MEKGRALEADIEERRGEWLIGRAQDRKRIVDEVERVRKGGGAASGTLPDVSIVTLPAGHTKAPKNQALKPKDGLQKGPPMAQIGRIERTGRNTNLNLNPWRHYIHFMPKLGGIEAATKCSSDNSSSRMEPLGFAM